jgi:hypothetical protein
MRVRRSARRRRQRYIYVLKSPLRVVNIMVYIDGLYVLKSPLCVVNILGFVFARNLFFVWFMHSQKSSTS